MSFAFASCQDWSSGYYSALKHLAEEDVDLVLHLGDYVYEGGIPADGGYRKTPVPEVLRKAPRDLARWRMQYALYKSDPNLQTAHAGFPWMVTWDDPSVTMLGQRQEQWLYDGLKRSKAQWDVLASNVMVGRLDHDGKAGDLLWHDAWDGCPAARQRLIQAWREAKTRNPVVVTGDWHSTFVNDIHADFDREGTPVVATEFVGTSLSSNGDREVYGPYYGPMIPFNPHIKFFDGDRRGYVRCTLDRDEFRADLRMVRTVSRRDAPDYTHASFVVEDGRPGAHQL